MPGLSSTYVDLRILETFLQIFIDCLIGNFADQSKVRNPDFLLFRALKHRFSNFWLPPAII